MTVSTIYAQAGNMQIGATRVGFDGYRTFEVTKETIILQPVLMEDLTASNNIYFGQAVGRGGNDDRCVSFNLSSTNECIGIATQDLSTYTYYFQADDNVPVMRMGRCRVMTVWDLDIPAGTHMKPIFGGLFYPTNTGARTASAMCMVENKITASDYGYSLGHVLLYP